MARIKITNDYEARWQRIKEAMHRAGIKSQAELAKRLGVSQPAVTHWKKGSFNPDPEHYVELSRQSGLCVQYLWTGRGPKLDGQPDAEYVERLRHILDSLPESQREEILRFAEFHSQQSKGKSGKK